MQNPETNEIQNSTTNPTPPPSHDDATNAPNHQPQNNPTHDHESPQSHSTAATDSPPPEQVRPPSPPPRQSQMIMPPPQPPFYQPISVQMPPYIPHFQLPPYLNYQPYPPLHGYPVMYPGPGPITYMEKRSWSTGLCDCFSDIKNCFITAFCPCVTFGQVSEILNEGQTPWWEGAVNYVSVEIATGAIGTFFCGWAYRAKMRKKHLLEGDFLTDLILSCFCTRLALCQMYRQLDHLGYSVALGWKASKEKQDQRAVGNWNCRYQVAAPVVEPGMFR